jgi:outer membrane receptor protein involved in Fe transport
MTTTDIDGTHEERGGARIHETRMAFVSRELVFGNFQGEHTIPELGGLQIGYGLGLAAARRDQPDTRASVWQRSSHTADDGSTSDVYSFEDDSQSGMHFFADQSELSRTFKLDLTQPLGTEARPVSLKLGTLVNLRDRAFQARRFRFRPNPDSTIEGQPEEVASRINCPGSVYRADCPSRLFNGDSVERGLIVLEENTRDTDGYEAGLDVGAGYAMFDASVAPSFRVYGGPRLEVSSQTIQAFNPSTGKRADMALALDEAVLLPALGAVWSPTARVNLRASGTQTVARPQLREIAPFSFTDYFGGREIAGNPELGNTKIVNADLRTEFFPSSREVVAVSAFYKRFIDPIEQIVLNAGARGLSTFANAKGADLFGIELESRKTLDFLHPSLLPFSLVANVSFTRSRVDLTEEQAETVTNLSRPLSRSAPYMGNVSLDFEEPEWGTRVRLLYNVIGPRLVEVGTRPGPGAGIPDTYERERHLVDVTFGQSIGEHLELRASVSNLLDSPIVRAQEGQDGAEDIVLREVRVGQTVSFGMQATY